MNRRRGCAELPQDDLQGRAVSDMAFDLESGHHPGQRVLILRIFDLAPQGPDKSAQGNALGKGITSDPKP